ncbi:YceD family protein [Fibrella aquatica]|uniref:YceD family protein n=1 Tax=Fibrella aquatica TaxID=3242487 RepID=UPI003521E5BA
MNELRQYDINIVGLEEKRYEFDFQSDKSFFKSLEQQLITKGDVKTNLVLDKSETMIRLDFSITGSVERTCDRSLDMYDEEVDTRQTLFLKFADRNEELTDEIELIERNTATINVARYIFDYIVLSMPMRGLHPRFREEDEEDDLAEGKLIYSSGDVAETDTDEEKEEKTAVDPRWEALRKLSNN